MARKSGSRDPVLASSNTNQNQNSGADADDEILNALQYHHKSRPTSRSVCTTESSDDRSELVTHKRPATTPQPASQFDLNQQIEAKVARMQAARSPTRRPVNGSARPSLGLQNSSSRRGRRSNNNQARSSSSRSPSLNNDERSTGSNGGSRHSGGGSGRRGRSNASTSSAGAASGSFSGRHSRRRTHSTSSSGRRPPPSPGLGRKASNRRARSSSSSRGGSVASAPGRGTIPLLPTIDSPGNSSEFDEPAIPSTLHVPNDPNDVNDNMSVVSGLTSRAFDDTSTIYSADRSRASRRRRQETVVEATVAQDYEDELEQAREQGRREALNRLGNNDNIAVAVPTGSDDEIDDDMSKDEVDGDDKRKRTILCYVALLCCIIIVIGSAGTLLLFRGNSQSPAPIVEKEDDSDSNIKGVIVYNPPTPEECDAIRTGTLLMDQQELLRRSFDIQIEITLESEADFGPLLNDLVRHIQQRLLPMIAGCGAIDFFDATMAIADGLSKHNNTAVANGKVQKSEEEDCIGNPEANCKSYVLILDLYLEEERSSAILLEAIGETITADEIASTFGTLYPILSASVPTIIPVAERAPTPIPVQDDATSGTLPPFSTPTLATSEPNSLPTDTPVLADPTAPTDAPVSVSTDSPVSETTFSPILEPTDSPVSEPTDSPVSEQTDTPVSEPTDAPIPDPTDAPVSDPTDAPVPEPTDAPVPDPTAAPVPEPTDPPTKGPTKNPTKAPTDPPSNAPSNAPSNVPTSSPTKAPTAAATGNFCCSTDFLTCNVDGGCGTSQEACEACNNSAWIEEGACTTGLGRNDDCSENQSGCCGGTCVTMGGSGNMQCRV